MYPFSYTGLKIVHDEQIREVLARRLPGVEQKLQWPGLHQAPGKKLPSFNAPSSGTKTRGASSWLHLVNHSSFGKS